MTKKIVIGFFCALFLTVVFWRVSAFLSLGGRMDDAAFIASPILAVVISVLLVRSRLMTSNRLQADNDA
jgi:predicted PurR-regulated permease PerM